MITYQHTKIIYFEEFVKADAINSAINPKLFKGTE